MTTHRPIDRRRQQVFLQVLRETGSVSGAAAAATPHSDGAKDGRPGYRSFLDLMKRDPEFAREVEEAKNHALGLVEKTIADRAFNPEQVPIFSRGELVGYKEERRDANQLLLRLAERLDPESWSPKKQIKGEVEHKHLHGHLVLQLEQLDVLSLDERGQLLSLLDLIEERTREPDQLPPGGTAQGPVPVLGHAVSLDRAPGRPEPAVGSDHRPDVPRRVD